MKPDARVDQLLQIGARLFGSRPYEDVRIEQIAEAAGVSRGLMYRYFPTKRDLFRAIVLAATEHVQAETTVDSALPLGEQINAGVDRFLEVLETNIEFVRAVNYGAASADPELQAILTRARRHQEEQIVQILAGQGVTVTPALRLATRGWLMMTRALALDWLDSREISREELRELCARAGRCLLLGHDHVEPTA